MNDKHIVKYYYNNKFIGYHNSFGESKGMIWTRIYTGNDEKYIIHALKTIIEIFESLR